MSTPSAPPKNDEPNTTVAGAIESGSPDAKRATQPRESTHLIMQKSSDVRAVPSKGKSKKPSLKTRRPQPPSLFSFSTASSLHISRKKPSSYKSALAGSPPTTAPAIPNGMPTSNNPSSRPRGVKTGQPPVLTTSIAGHLTPQTPDASAAPAKSCDAPSTVSKPPSHTGITQPQLTPRKPPIHPQRIQPLISAPQHQPQGIPMQPPQSKPSVPSAVLLQAGNQPPAPPQATQKPQKQPIARAGGMANQAAPYPGMAPVVQAPPAQQFAPQPIGQMIPPVFQSEVIQPDTDALHSPLIECVFGGIDDTASRAMNVLATSLLRREESNEIRSAFSIGRGKNMRTIVVLQLDASERVPIVKPGGKPGVTRLAGQTFQDIRLEAPDSALRVLVDQLQAVANQKSPGTEIIALEVEMFHDPFPRKIPAHALLPLEGGNRPVMITSTHSIDLVTQKFNPHDREDHRSRQNRSSRDGRHSGRKRALFAEYTYVPASLDVLFVHADASRKVKVAFESLIDKDAKPRQRPRRPVIVRAFGRVMDTVARNKKTKFSQIETLSDSE